VQALTLWALRSSDVGGDCIAQSIVLRMKLRFEIMLTMKRTRCRSWMVWSSFSALMPDSVIDRSKIHENKTGFSSSLIALFNVASQFDNLLDSRATSSKATLLGRTSGGRQQAQVETEGGVQAICTEHRSEIRR